MTEQKLVLRILRDILEHSDHDWPSLSLLYNYSVSIEEQKQGQVDEKSIAKVVKLGLFRPQKDITPLLNIDFDLISLRNSTRSGSYASKSVDNHSTGNTTAGRSTKPFFLKKNFQEHTFNLESDSNLYNSSIAPILLKPGNRMEQSEYKQVSDFYKSHVLTDNERKVLWKKRIGNKLNISRDKYLGLLSRLGTEKFSSSANRTITKDLLRDIPNQDGEDESSQMFVTVKRVLRLFVLYRPDIGYI